MKKKMIWICVLLLVIVFLGPVIFRLAFPPSPRRYRGTGLNELTYKEITFQNNTDNLMLSGLMFVPEGNRPFPAAVVIHGSGTSHRDNIWYLTLVQHLQENGIVVLLPDKRGSEQSQGNCRTSSFEDLANDTIAALEYLKEQNTVPISHTGIIGMSQGGWVAPVVATKTRDVSFIINVVGTSVTAYEQLSYEENNNLREMGVL